jgi:hypothetical protein
MQLEESDAALLESLGLDPGATPEEVEEVISDLIDAEDENEALINRLQEERGALLNAQVERDLDDAGITNEAERQTWRDALLDDRAATLPLLESKSGQTSGAVPLTNRAPASAPHRPVGTSTAEDEQRASAIRNRATEIQAASKGITFDQAWLRAEAEIGRK